MAVSPRLDSDDPTRADPDIDAANPDATGTAVAHATSNVPTARAGESAAAVRASLIGESFDYADEIAVLEDGRLTGLLSIERLLDAPDDARVESLMDPDPPLAEPGADQHRVARRMVDHGETGIVVVDTDGRFLGLIPAHRMLDVLLDEHERLLARLAGYLAGSRQARGAAQEAVGQRLWHRLPWLLIGLAGAMLSAVIMSAFERTLDETVLIAFFVPAVVYLAGAVGTQTQAVLIRGMSAGVAIRSVLRRELISGVIIGVLLGAVFLAFATFAWGDEQVALAVALALLMSCSISTFVAIALPWIFERFGTDPAFGSGPLATVIQDLLAMLAYLMIAMALTG